MAPEDIDLAACEVCGGTFAWKHEGQLADGKKWLCPECVDRLGYPAGSAASPSRTFSSSLKLLPPSGSLGQADSQALFDDSFSDLSELLNEAFSPLDPRRRTFWEWLSGLDLKELQREQKAEAGSKATKLAGEKTAVFNAVREMLESLRGVRRAQRETQIDNLKGRLEWLRLHEEIAEREAGREHRQKIRELEAALKERELLKQLNPPAPLPRKTDKEWTEEFMARQRNEKRTAAAVRQHIALDFLGYVRKIYSSDRDDFDKLFEIWAVMDGYEKGPEDLPKEIRTFVEDLDDWIADED